MIVSMVYIENRTYSIYSVEDFYQMTINPDGKYVIKNDIDMKEYQFKDNFQFEGKLDGRNHQLTNLSTPLFSRIENATIENLHLTEVSIDQPEVRRVGALSTEAHNSIITNVQVTGIVVGKQYVGSLIGEAYASKIKQTSFKGSVTGMDAIGGLTGTGGVIHESYVEGDIEGILSVGGFVGKAGWVYHSLANVNLKGEYYIAGSASCISLGCYTENSILLGTIVVKENGHSIAPTVSLIDSSSSHKNNLFLGKIKLPDSVEFINQPKVYVLDHTIEQTEESKQLIYLTDDQVTSKEFYLDIGFTEDKWSFDQLDQQAHPSLKWLRK